MGLGKLWLWLNVTFGHGLRVAFWRDVRRPQILSTLPVRGTTDRACEVHVLTCASDWLNTIWALKSLYHFSRRRYALCIHEDGSLGHEELSALAEHFPEARIVDRPTADQRLDRVLRNRPQSARFRATNPLALKVFDFSVFLEAERLLLLDSDVLFFAEPTELLRRLEDQSYRLNSLNRDWGYGYSVAAEQLRAVVPKGFQEGVNSGLGVIHRASIRLDAIEEWLTMPEIWSHDHRIEQTLIALYSCLFGHEFLPREYDVHLGPFSPTLPCRHFTGPIRHMMYSDGMRVLAGKGLLKHDSQLSPATSPRAGGT